MIGLTFSKREKSISILAILTILTALGYSFVLEPLLQKWNALNDEIIIKRARLKKGLRLLEKRQNIIDEYNSYASLDIDPSKILSHIERLSGSLEVEITNIVPRPIVHKGLYGEYVIELKIIGLFSNINEFLTALNQSPLYITIKEFDLSEVKDASSKLKGTLILSKLLI